MTNTPNTVILTGTHFGRLLVLGPIVSRNYRRASRVYWQCRCACGVTVVRDTARLVTGQATSCGCATDAWLRAWRP